MQFIAQCCYLVVVSASDQNAAYRIFSVLNDRGLDLSPTDILKADIIGSMEKGVRSRHTKTWENIEESLGRDRFRDLFAHIYMIFMTSRPRGTLQQEIPGPRSQSNRHGWTSLTLYSNPMPTLTKP